MVQKYTKEVQHMLYNKPTIKSPSKAGYLETYHLETENTKVSIHTVVGGYESFLGVNNKQRLAYVLRGIGTAIFKPEDKTVATLLEGTAVEVPAAQSFEMDGQLRYVLVESTNGAEILKNTKEENVTATAGDDSTLIYVLNGIGNLVIDGKIHVLREETLAEVPANSTYELKGNFEYIIARG